MYFPLKERAAVLERTLKGCLKERDAEGSFQAGNLKSEIYRIMRHMAS